MCEISRSCSKQKFKVLHEWSDINFPLNYESDEYIANTHASYRIVESRPISQRKLHPVPPKLWSSTSHCIFPSHLKRFLLTAIPLTVLSEKKSSSAKSWHRKIYIYIVYIYIFTSIINIYIQKGSYKVKILQQSPQKMRRTWKLA